MQKIELQPNPNNFDAHVSVEPLESLEQERFNSLDVVTGIENLGIAIEDKEGVAQSLDVIRSEFEIEETALEDTKGRLMLTSIAHRLNTLEKEPASHGQTSAELEYIADLVMLAAGPKSRYASEHKATLDTRSVSSERTIAAYDKFTQPELTKELEEFIKGAEFDDVRARLGIQEEEPYEVRVLSVDSEDGYQSNGLVPNVQFIGTTKEEFEEDVKEDQARKDYLEGLKQNGIELNKLLDREGSFAPAWVTTMEDGKKILCMPSPIAEKVMYKDEERASHYSEEDRQRDMAVIKHEYTHTQKMLLFDGSIGLGIALEELRAEHFSGDKHGYQDIKRYFSGMRMLTGYSPKDSFEIDGDAYDESEFLTDIAKKTGIEGFLDVMTVIPENYASDETASPYVKAVVKHNGGSLSAQFENMYIKTVERDGVDAVDSRVSEFVDKIRDALKDSEYVSVESWFHYAGNNSLGRIASENFRRRYPDESDGYDYSKHYAEKK